MASINERMLKCCFYVFFSQKRSVLSDLICTFALNKLYLNIVEKTFMDIRWIQRYDNYHKACKRVLEITESDRFVDDLSDLEMEGLVQRFEYTFELAWKVLQDLMKYKGYEFVQGPNGTLAQAFEDGIISDHDGWRQMARARITTAHTYDEDDVKEVAHDIYGKYASLLKMLDQKLEKEKNNLK